MDFAAVVKEWAEKNSENPISEIVAWIAEIIAFIATL